MSKVSKTYVKVSKGDEILFIRVPVALITLLFDFLHDSGFKVEAVDKETWLDKIDLGLSYKVKNKKEVEIFIRNNIKYLTYKKDE